MTLSPVRLSDIIGAAGTQLIGWAGSRRDSTCKKSSTMSCVSKSAAMRHVANRMREAGELPFENARMQTSESKRTSTRVLRHSRRISYRTASSSAEASSSLICAVSRQRCDTQASQVSDRTKLLT